METEIRSNGAVQALIGVVSCGRSSTRSGAFSPNTTTWDYEPRPWEHALPYALRRGCGTLTRSRLPTVWQAHGGGLVPLRRPHLTALPRGPSSYGAASPLRRGTVGTFGITGVRDRNICLAAWPRGWHHNRTTIGSRRREHSRPVADTGAFIHHEIIADLPYRIPLALTLPRGARDPRVGGGRSRLRVQFV